MTATAVSSCSVLGCSFNHDGCSADSITVAGSESHATCVTFIGLDLIGGTRRPHAHVGACQRIECMFNDHLLCGAESVIVGGDHDCLTYAAR